jgi:hypothetical protein
MFAINLGLFALQLVVWGLPPSMLGSLTFVQTSVWVFCLSAASMAALIGSRRPRNPIGWWLGILALAWSAGVVLQQYALYALVRNPGALPAGELALWLGQWVTVPVCIAWIHLLLLFPSGRLISNAWGTAVIWLATAGISFYVVERAFTPGSIDGVPLSLPTNPFALSWVPPLLGRGGVGQLVYLTCSVLALGCVIYRMRHGRGPERQQLKWFFFGAAWLLVGIVLPLLGNIGYPIDPKVSSTVASLVLVLLPVTMAIGILNYRLFDIDVVINRTLVYGSVTATLAGVFAALSIVAQRLTLAITGQESEAAVVVAALIVTALFQPFRARVQTLVDRRFYRSKYDVGRTLERFASQVRDEVELERLTHSLVGVVQETMQPKHASLWLLPRTARDAGKTN